MNDHNFHYKHLIEYGALKIFSDSTLLPLSFVGANRSELNHFMLRVIKVDPVALWETFSTASISDTRFNVVCLLYLELDTVTKVRGAKVR